MVSSQVTLGTSTLGYEWDPEQDAYASYYPAGRIRLSQTEVNGKRHHLSLYRHPSGAFVFGAGTVQWSWGLDYVHDRGNASPSLDMQQATVNLFADMGVQPGSLQSDLKAATVSTDTTPPLTAITSPSPGGAVNKGAPITISGTASDIGGVVAGVEISVDGGSIWSPAAGTSSWTFAWTPVSTGSVTIKSRAVDDSLNIQTVEQSIVVTVQDAPCPCTAFGTTTPANPDSNDSSPNELGVRFQVTVAGSISGLRFYKSASNTGTHIGNIWAEGGGTPLATITFLGESASGWQEAFFPTPVSVLPNTNYIASYHTTSGHYAYEHFFLIVYTAPDTSSWQWGYINHPVIPHFPTIRIEIATIGWM
jgi:large repetitive protein